jgi:hypothetical protein
MESFVARENVDNYLALLKEGNVAPERRAIVVKLLIAEEDRMGHAWEQLEFAETRAAKGRRLLSELRQMLNDGRLSNQALWGELVANAEATQNLLDQFCHYLRDKANSRL